MKKQIISIIVIFLTISIIIYHICYSKNKPLENFIWVILVKPGIGVDIWSHQSGSFQIEIRNQHVLEFYPAESCWFGVAVACGWNALFPKAHNEATFLPDCSPPSIDIIDETTIQQAKKDSLTQLCNSITPIGSKQPQRTNSEEILIFGFASPAGVKTIVNTTIEYQDIQRTGQTTYPNNVRYRDADLLAAKLALGCAATFYENKLGNNSMTFIENAWSSGKFVINKLYQTPSMGNSEFDLSKKLLAYAEDLKPYGWYVCSKYSNF